MESKNQTTLRALGWLLILFSVMFWLYRNDLNSLNNVILISLIIWGISRFLTRSDSSPRRTVKYSAAVVAIMLAVLTLGVTIALNFIDEFGADSEEHDSPNWHDGHFHNLNETSVTSGSWWKAMADMMVFDPSRTPNSVIPTEPFVIRDLEHDHVSITWFGHSTILIQSNSHNILIDPLFGDQAMGPLSLGPAPFEYENRYEIEDLPPIDAVLISHDHYDHLDMDTITQIEGADFFTPLGTKSHLELWGIPSDRIQGFDWYEGTEVSEELALTLTPSQHFSGRGLVRDTTLWGSWVIELENTSIFFGGDGGYMPEFKTIGDLYGPFDISLLEAGQYNEAWSNIHMMPEEVVQASIDLNSSMVLPIHNSKYELALHSWDEPLREVTAEGLRRNHTVVTPLVGQSFILHEETPQDHWWEDVAPYEEPFIKSNPFLGMAIPIVLIIAIALIRSARIVDSSEEE